MTMIRFEHGVVCNWSCFLNIALVIEGLCNRGEKFIMIGKS